MKSSVQVTRRIRQVLKVRSGVTCQEVCFGGVLSSDFIRTHASAMAPGLRAEIARAGIDKARLTAGQGLGQYSFSMGDHTLRDRSSEISSLF
jgi:hypothetical protein